MASFILSLLPEDFFCDLRVELRHHKITYGFNATNTVVYNHPVPYGWSTRKFTKPTTLTNTMTLLGKTMVCEDGALCINDGINMNFVKTGGEVDVDALYASIKASDFKPDVRWKLIEILDESLNGSLDRSLSRRNLVLPIYNMLRLYFIKRWASVRYEPEEVFYDDGHIRISNKQMYDCAESRIFGASPVSSVPVIKLWNTTSTDVNYVDDMCIKWGSHIYPQQVRVIQDAFGAWESDAPFILHHECPMFYETVYINGIYSEFNIKKAQDYTARDVLRTIKDFVTYNRAWTHFYYAFIMLCQAMVLPTPRKAESVAWTVDPVQIRLPVPSNWMGWFSELHSGPHLEMETEAQSSFKWFLDNPDATLWAAIALIEGSYMMLPLMHMYQVDTRHVGSDWLYEATSISSSVGGGMQVDLALIAALTGHDITLAYPVTCGVNRTVLKYVTDFGTEVEVEVLDSKLPEFYSFIEEELTASKIMWLRSDPRSPSVYPVLFYGLRSYDYYGDTLSTKLSFKAPQRRSSEDEMFFTDKRKFADFMNIAMLTGNDVVATLLRDNRKIINRADNRIGRFLCSDIPNEVYYGFLVKFSDVQPRSGCWLKVTDMRGNVSLKLTIDYKRYFIKYGRDGHEDEDKAIVSHSPMRIKLPNYENSNATNEVIMPTKHTIKALQVQEEDFDSLSLGLATGSETQGTMC